MSKEVGDIFWGVAKTNAELKHAAEFLMRDHVFDPMGQLFNEYMKILLDKRRNRSIIYYASKEELEYNHVRLYGAIMYFPLLGIIHIYVKPDYRRQGIAQRLLDNFRRYMNLENKLLSSWGTIYDEGNAFFKKNFIYTYNYDIPKEHVDALGGDGGKAFRSLNKRHKAALRKKMLAHLRESSKNGGLG